MTMKTLSTAELQRELARRESSVGKLQAKRDTLLARLRDVEAEISAITGNQLPARGRGPARATTANDKRPRAKNDVSLADAIAQAMDVGAEMSPKEAAGYVLKNGYKTASKTFGIQVASALAKDGRFKRVGRGVYERVK